MNERPAKPTLEDVAQISGVSTATVSRCLNSPDKVVEQTRNRVMKAVRDLGYSPNFGARAMVAKRTNTMGAVIPTMANAIFARGLQSFQEELWEKGYHLLVSSSSYRADFEEEQVRSLIARGADGLLLIGLDRSPSILKFLEQRGLPTLVAWTYSETSDLPTVGFDNRRAMQELAEQVIAMGHRKIGVISAPMVDNDRARARFDGVRDALREAGLPDDSLPLIETPYDIGNGSVAFAEMFAVTDPPTAILCGNDVLAAGAIRQAKEMGLNIPGDVSITGFDDIELAAIVEPTLTTVHVPHREMGRTAARLLVEMVENGTSPKSRALQTFVQMRNSLAAP
ncbi:MAG: LacI family DNA-binding transcriptional regulator [Pseudomonadota bacterium]